MKKFIALFVFVLASSLAFSQPKLEVVGGTSYDWGMSNPNQSPLKATIKITNTGDSVLKIIEVKPGCGCTTAPIDKNEIQPGDTAHLNVTLNISSYTGEITKSVKIVSNDPKVGDTYFYLKTNVFRPIVVKNSNYLGKSIMHIGTEETFDYKLFNNTDKPIKITGVTVNPETAKLDIKKGDVLPASGNKPYTIKYAPTDKGRVQGTLKINTDNPDAKEIVIYFYGNVVNDEQYKNPDTNNSTNSNANTNLNKTNTVNPKANTNPINKNK